ncbi:DegQ family serine endoprotease [Candidatus Nitronereus thalassa]|uniref:DegQ family serine endoprotease n=1 Tax=Candidatus Nitronereus thalassa TaxID=3020898 RepID=A0ABU3K3E7_9BACT|nr:DegQ family serine endoprotease [Candidatus Nitronereus thalassa]MDT7040932.1 DegQ family serine endoprotease [Candidatus Nitronereus thalassa]
MKEFSQTSPTHSQSHQKSGRWSSPRTSVSLALAGLLLGSMIVGSMDSPPSSIAEIAEVPKSTTQIIGDQRHGFAHIVKAVRPAIVNITSTRVLTNSPGPDFHNDGPNWFGPGQPEFPGMPPMPREPFSGGMGSGVLVSPDGYLVTNHHVVDGASKVTVTLIDKREFIGTVVGSDPQTDLAVIKIPGKDFPYIPWGDSSKLEVGEYVLAIGNPFGLNSTVTQGIVSALGRGGMGITKYEDFIQTDAAINPGNSGGALVNMQGELVGINTAILSRTGGYQGVGFAIPTSMGKHVFDSVVKTGTVRRGYLGVGIQEVSKDLATSLNLPDTTGALVTNVQENSPADKAGLERGDTIVSFQDQPVDDPRRLQQIVTGTAIGDQVKMGVIRDGKALTLSTILVEHPDTRKVANITSPSVTTKLAGLTVEEITPQMARRLKLTPDVQGVVVTAVQPGSKADDAGLIQGDIINEVNRKPVRNVKDYESAISNTSDERPALLLIHRQGVPIFLTVKV